jgi:SecD/SecF fusion protein
MDEQSESRWKDLMLAGAVTITVPILVFVVWPLASVWFPSTPRGPVLVYEVPGDSKTDERPIDLEQIAKVVDQRLHPDGKQLAVVRPLENRRIEVAVFSKADADVQQAEQLLADIATLQIRLLATTWRDEAIIAQATADPAKKQLLDKDGRVVAEWLPMRPGGEKGIADYTDIARRMQKHGDRDITEVLVIHTPDDLPGLYLKKAKATTNRIGRPSMEFCFDAQGAKIFSELTGQHQPDQTGKQISKLAVVINGEVYFAPVVMNTIRESAQIASFFSMKELERVAQDLMSGVLGTKLRLVSKTDAE